MLLLVLLTAAPAQASTHRFKLRAGPYKLAGYNTQFPLGQVKVPKVKGYVTSMRARLVDSKGRPILVNEAMLHHVFFTNLARTRVPGNCSGTPPEVFYGTGEENEVMRFPAGYGYRLKRGDRWKMGAMIMAHRWRPSNIYLEYSGTVDTSRRLTGVRPFWVRANGCDGSGYHVRGGGLPGSVDDRVNHWTVPMTGRIVAAGGHLHAGALAMQLRDPACGDRVLFDNTPFYAPPSDLLYTAVPKLHEAGPIQTSWFTSGQGIPVTKGQALDLHGIYEGQYARQLVMAIAHIYIAPGRAEPAGCPPLPRDARQEPMQAGLRAHAPYEPIPLWRLDDRHLPVRMTEPPGPATPLPDGGVITLKGNRFGPTEKVVIKAGSTINWRFEDPTDHQISFASGPRAVAGQTLGKGGRTSTQFDVPGRYQLFCYLHPMTMREQVDVVP